MSHYVYSFYKLQLPLNNIFELLSTVRMKKNLLKLKKKNKNKKIK